MKLQASGPSGWQVPAHPVKGERDMALIVLAALAGLAAFGEMPLPGWGERGKSLRSWWWKHGDVSPDCLGDQGVFL